MLNIGILLSSDNREEEAEEYYESALLIREKSLGINHPSMAVPWNIRAFIISLWTNWQKQKKTLESPFNPDQSNQALFPIMSEQERELFYLQVHDDVSRYNYVAGKLLGDSPELIKYIFDFQVKTKMLLFNSLDKVRDLVEASEDLVLVAEYQKWLSDKRYWRATTKWEKIKLSELHVNLKLVEADIESQEKTWRGK